MSGDTLFYDCRNDAYHVEIVSYSPLQLEYIFDTTYYESKITQLDSSITILWYNDTSSYSDTSVEFDSYRCNALIASHSFVYWDSPDPKSGNEAYGVGLGMVHFDRYDSDNQQYDLYMDMFYYKKDTVECGTPDLTTSSINKFSLSNCISVYPNPFTNSTTIQSDVVLKDATLTLYDAVGNQVRIIKNISGQTIHVERDNLPSGMYFCQLTQDNYVVATKKLMVSDN